LLKNPNFVGRDFIISYTFMHNFFQKYKNYTWVGLKVETKIGDGKKFVIKNWRKILWKLKLVIFIQNKNIIETKNDDKKKLWLKVERKLYRYQNKKVVMFTEKKNIFNHASF
jgi:ligand-binding sensor domain-containing protein